MAINVATKEYVDAQGGGGGGAKGAYQFSDFADVASYTPGTSMQSTDTVDFSNLTDTNKAIGTVRIGFKIKSAGAEIKDVMKVIGPFTSATFPKIGDVDYDAAVVIPASTATSPLDVKLTLPFYGTVGNFSAMTHFGITIEVGDDTQTVSISDLYVQMAVMEYSTS